MLQDLKVGHILGGTPWKMQIGDLLGVALAASVMFLPFVVLHVATSGPARWRSRRMWAASAGRNLPAAAGELMALLSQGIVGRHMAWPLNHRGRHARLRHDPDAGPEPDAVCVGMYINLGTTFAIFVGGRDPGNRELDRQGAESQRCAESARREQRDPDRLRG